MKFSTRVLCNWLLAGVLAWSGSLYAQPGPEGGRQGRLSPEERHQMRQQMREHWQQMPPEQKEYRRQEMRERWQQMPQEDRQRWREERRRQGDWQQGGRRGGY